MSRVGIGGALAGSGRHAHRPSPAGARRDVRAYESEVSLADDPRSTVRADWEFGAWAAADEGVFVLITASLNRVASSETRGEKSGTRGEKSGIDGEKSGSDAEKAA